MRPLKDGLDYMTLDCDMWTNKKIRLFIAEFGIEEKLPAFATLVLLLMRIYGGKGYYLVWDDDERLLFSHDIGIDSEFCEEVVKAAIKRGIFDFNRAEETLVSGEKTRVLTSETILSRFVSATQKRTKIIIDTEIAVSGGINLVTDAENRGLRGQKYTKKEEKVLGGAVTTGRNGNRIGSGRECPYCHQLYYGDECMKLECIEAKDVADGRAAPEPEDENDGF